MIDQVGNGGGAARVIRAGDVGRMVAAAPPRANDNRRRRERPAMPLARLALAGTAGYTADSGAGIGRPTEPPPTVADGPALPVGLGAGFLAPQLAIWSAGVGATWRLPPFSSSLALYRAWSELGLAGAASCASLAASGIEIIGAALLSTLAATMPKAASRR